MSAVWRSLGVRLTLASLAAVAALVALHGVVAARERQEATKQVAIAAPAPSPLGALGFRIAATAGSVLLASRVDALAPAVAPVLQVLADGSLALRRPPPLAAAPGGPSGARPVGVVVPGGPLAAWSPAARGTLVELLGALLLDRPVAQDQVQVVDVPLGEAELRMLLAWVH